MNFLNCAQCDRKIRLNPKLRVDITWWGKVQPETNYWNIERKEVYCNVYCSFERHEELRKDDTR